MLQHDYRNVSQISRLSQIQQPGKVCKNGPQVLEIRTYQTKKKQYKAVRKNETVSD